MPNPPPRCCERICRSSTEPNSCFKELSVTDLLSLVPRPIIEPIWKDVPCPSSLSSSPSSRQTALRRPPLSRCASSATGTSIGTREAACARAAHAARRSSGSRRRRRAASLPTKQHRSRTGTRSGRQIGCETAPANRARAEAAISELYADLGKSAPKFVWVQSPAAARLTLWRQLGRGRLCLGRQYLGQRITNPLNPMTRVERGLWDYFASEVRDPLRGQLITLAHQLEPLLNGQLGRQADAQLRDTVERKRSGTTPELYGGPRGQHEAHWIAIHVIARDFGGVCGDRRTAGSGTPRRGCSPLSEGSLRNGARVSCSPFHARCRRPSRRTPGPMTSKPRTTRWRHEHD